MKDIVLLDTKRLAEVYIRQADKDDTLIACRNLLQLSYKKGLLQKNPFGKKGDLNIDTVIKEGDLTNLGKQLFDDSADKRFVYTDRTQGYDSITMLKKYLNSLNNGQCSRCVVKIITTC